VIQLHKYIGGPWEQVRKYLLEDLETIESSVNTRWAALFDSNNRLRAAALPTEVSSVLITTTEATDEPAGSKLAKHRFCGGL
jgi:hypothetical protein